MEPDLLEKLCCPETHQPLTLAEAELVERLNQRVAAGQLHNRAGRRVDVPLEAGLVREDRAWLYPVRQDIPVMLVDEAIELS